jgi:hypothetical protein
MSDDGAPKGLRERLAGGTEDRLGRALTDLFENPLLHGALGRASDAREKAAQAQEVAMGALNLPSAADIERLTRRLRSVSQRLEGIEDGVHRLGRTLSGPSIDARLAAIEQQLQTLATKLEDRGKAVGASAAEAGAKLNRTASAKRPAAKRPAAKRAAAKRTAAKRTAAKPRRASADRPAAKRSAAKGPDTARAARGRTASEGGAESIS